MGKGRRGVVWKGDLMVCVCEPGADKRNKEINRRNKMADFILKEYTNFRLKYDYANY